MALTGTGQDFALTAGTNSAAVTAGGTATYALAIAPESGFTGAVTLACSGAPSESTCTVSPSSVTPDGTNNAPATLSVSTTAPSATLPLAPNSPQIPPAIWIALLGLLALVAPVYDRRRRSQSVASPFRATSYGGQKAASTRGRVWARRPMLAALATLAALLLAVAVWSSCGGGGAVHVPSGGTPMGSYTMTVTATSGSLVHTTSVTLTVQ